MNSYPAIIIKKDRERAIRNRHPWLFSGAIDSIEENVSPGDIVQVMNKSKEVLAYGFYQGDRTIAARLFEFSPKQAIFSDEYWAVRFLNALDLRKSAGLLNQQNAGYRLIFSEGDFLPGLIVDIFGDCASLQITANGIEKKLPLLIEFLKSELAVKHIFDGQWQHGRKEEVEFCENEIILRANVESGQKTGYFFDQRDNRRLLQTYASGKNVLDTFCYSGGFTCNALKGLASSVTSVDISKDAIEICAANVEQNRWSDRHESVVADCFDYLRQMKKDQFDVIVLDPPAFAKSAHTVERATRGYKDINLSAMQKIAKGGLIFTFSCSQHISNDLFQKIVFGAAKDAGRNIRVLHHLSQGADHPFDICHPEGEYLKGLVISVC